MKQTGFYMMVALLLLTSSIVFSQERKEPCYYQPPKISCELASQNAEAIFNYPLALKSLGEKDELIRIKVRELASTKDEFAQERIISSIDLATQTAKTEKQRRRKVVWQVISGALATALTTVSVILAVK